MEDSPKPLNILALDGGGVRGLSSLLILRSLMDQLKTVSGLETVPRPCEVFDLICGTSTGGLIALMLGRLRMDVQTVIDCYLKFSEEIFGHQVPVAWYRILSGDARYDAKVLEKCVKDIVKKYGGDGDAPLKDPLAGKEGCCPTFVVAVTRSYADSPPKRFRSYPTKTQPAATCKIWEAARATSAANTFFAPMQVGVPPQTFIDGAFSGANNPSQLARDEARDLFPGRPVGCFLSLGTGVSKVVAVRGNLAKIAQACVKLVTSCELVNDAVGKEFRKETPKGQSNPYFRFSVEQGLQGIMLDEWERVEELTGVTDGYMASDVQQERAEKCIEALKTRVVEQQQEEAEAATLL